METQKTEEVLEPTQESEEQKTKEAVALVMKEKGLYESATQTWRTEVGVIWDAYNGKMTDRAYPWKSKKFIPKMRTELSYIIPFIFSGNPELEIGGVGDEDKFISEQLEKIANYRMDNDLQAFDQVSKWVGQGTLLGTSLIKACWKFDTKPNPDGTRTPVADMPKWEVPNIMDIFVDPTVAAIEDQVSVIERITMPLEKAKKVSYYKNTEQLTAGGNTTSNPYDSSKLNDTDVDNQMQLKSGMDTVEIFERWSDDRIITVANGKEPVLLRDEPNPYGFIPYEKFIFEEDPLPNRFYGRGIGQNTKDLQAMYYDMFNEIIDNLHLVINKMFSIKRGAKINPNQLVAKPGGFIERDDKDDVEEIQITDIKQSAFEVLGRVDDEHKRASGANDLLQGSSSNSTLGQDQMAQSNSSNRFELVRRRLKDAMSGLGKKTMLMEVENLQDMNSPILRIFPQESRESIFGLLKQLAPEMMWNVRIKGDTIMHQNKDIVSKQMIDLLNIIADKITNTEFRANVREIYRLRGIQSIDELVGSEAPMQQVDPMTGQPIPQMGAPMDGEALPDIEGQSTQQGINSAVYAQ